jgi:hypothetical protein
VPHTTTMALNAVRPQFLCCAYSENRRVLNFHCRAHLVRGYYGTATEEKLVTT